MQGAGGSSSGVSLHQAVYLQSAPCCSYTQNLMIDTSSNGIHHITAISGDAQRNADFYVRALGMRLVKRTVNQEDTSTYHLFYGNSQGSPGSALSFFSWPMAQKGKPGLGEPVKVALAVPSYSMGFWAEQFGKEGIDFDGPYDRFGQQAFGFRDPDSMQLELVFDERVDSLPAWESRIPAEVGIRGLYGTTLRLESHVGTEEILTDLFRFKAEDELNGVRHYTTDAHLGRSIIIEEGEEILSARGRGTIEHVAFRVKDRDELLTMQEKVMRKGLMPSDVVDRHWFHSIYFSFYGGILFEIATDGPGYTIDEDPESLGERLILPPSLEPHREMIEKRLPPVRVP